MEPTLESGALAIASLLLPAVVLALAAIYIARMYFDYKYDELKKPAQNASPTGRAHTDELTIRLRIQALERFALYLERISPPRLVLRLNRAGIGAKMLQAELLKAIREEFDHNLSQQVYISDGAWQLICNAREETSKLVNLASDQFSEGASGYDLSKRIVEIAGRIEHMPHDVALKYLRAESAQILGIRN